MWFTRWFKHKDKSLMDQQLAEGAIEENMILKEKIKFMRNYESVVIHELHNFFENIANEAYRGNVSYFTQEQLEKIKDVINAATRLRNSYTVNPYEYYDLFSIYKDLLIYCELILCRHEPKKEVIRNIEKDGYHNYCYREYKEKIEASRYKAALGRPAE